MLEALRQPRLFGVSSTIDPATASTRLCVQGELDLAMVTVFTAEVDSLLVAFPAATLSIDLTKLDFLDPQGLRAVVRALSASASSRLIVDASPVRRLFELTGTGHLLDDQPPVVARATLRGTGGSPGLSHPG